jgi:hypothetical protein
LLFGCVLLGAAEHAVSARAMAAAANAFMMSFYFGRVKVLFGADYLIWLRPMSTMS